MPPEPLIFFHPDYTVGTGITPVHAFRLADYTAGGESHPALKIYYPVIIYVKACPVNYEYASTCRPFLFIF